MLGCSHLDKKILSKKPQIDGHNDGDYGGKNDNALSPPFVASLICEVGDDLHKHYSTKEASQLIIEGRYEPDSAHAMKVSTIGWANMQPKEKVCWTTRLADPTPFRNTHFSNLHSLRAATYSFRSKKCCGFFLCGCSRSASDLEVLVMRHGQQ